MVNKPGMKGRPGRMSMRLQWIKEFSDIGSEISNIDLLREAKASSGHLQYKRASTDGSLIAEESMDGVISPGVRRQSTVNSLYKGIEKNRHIL
jgi:hypothetical protein